MHKCCLELKMKWGGSSKCVDCRVQTVELTEAEEVWDKAVLLWIHEDYPNCFEVAKEAIKLDPHSAMKQSVVGDMYYQGLGVEKDVEAARSHYQIAIKGTDNAKRAGHSAFYIGTVLKDDWRFEEALTTFKFASGHHPEAAERVEYMEQFFACLERSKTDRRALRRFDLRLRSDYHFARRCVEIQGYTLDFLCDELKSNEEIVFEAVRQNYNALQFASPSLRGNRQFLHRLLDCTAWQEDSMLRTDIRSPRGVSIGGGWILEFASKEIQSDYDLVIKAVSKSGGALRFASEVLRRNREVVLTAVSQDGLALEFAPELQDNPDIVSAAVASNASAMKFASERLRGDEKFVLSLMRRSSFALRYASRELRENREFIIRAIQQDGMAVRWSYEKLRVDPALLLEAEQRCGWAMSQAPQELLNDHEYMLKAIKKSSQALNFAPKTLLDTTQFITEAVQTKGTALQFAPEKYHKDHQVVHQACLSHPASLYFADEKLREDSEFLDQVLGPQKKRLGSKSSRRSSQSGSASGATSDIEDSD